MRDYARLREQDTLDADWLAYQISQPLHHCTNTPQCDKPINCLLCSNAARLSVQAYRGKIEKRVVEHMVREYDAGCTMSHPGSD